MKGLSTKSALSFVSLFALACSVAAQTAMLTYEGVQAELAGYAARDEILVLRDAGEEKIVRKRPGRTKPVRMDLAFRWTSEGIGLQPLFQSAKKGIDRGKGAIVVTDRKGGLVDQIDFSGPIACEWRFPSAGTLRNDADSQFVELTVSAASDTKLRGEKIIHRDIAARSVLRLPGSLSGYAEDLSIRRALSVVGFSGAEVTEVMVDADNDGIADSSKLEFSRIVLQRTNADSQFIADWLKEVEAAGEKRISPHKDVVVIMGATGTHRIVLKFRGFPISTKSGGSIANDTYIVEELEFAVERVERG